MNPRSSPGLRTLGEALAWARKELNPSETGPLDASLLLAFLLKQSRTAVLSHPDEELPAPLLDPFRFLVARCAAGEPLAYLTGQKEFFGLAFEVTPAVLVPRPETETLVESALAWLLELRSRGKQTAWPPRVIDVGTGAGCIAAALAVRIPEIRIVATDISRESLAAAERNFTRHSVRDRIYPVQADLLLPFRGPFDLICANLPYIPTQTLNSLPAIRYEPRLALDGGPDGLRWIGRLLEQARTRLAPDSALLMEIESAQGEAVIRLAHNAFPGSKAIVRKDLAGKDRLLEIRAG